MPSTTAADVFATFPKFATVDQATIDLYLALASANLEDLWGDERYEYAVAFYAGFMMLAAGLGTGAGTSGGGAGDVTSKRIGSLAVTYASPSSGAAGAAGSNLEANKYGRLLLQLLAGQLITMFTSYV